MMVYRAALCSRLCGSVFNTECTEKAQTAQRTTVSTFTSCKGLRDKESLHNLSKTRIRLLCDAETLVSARVYEEPPINRISKGVLCDLRAFSVPLC